jgi:hypothetical protein
VLSSVKDRELKFEEIEVSHCNTHTRPPTVERGKVVSRGERSGEDAPQYTIVIWSRKRRHETWSDAQETKGPACM